MWFFWNHQRSVSADHLAQSCHGTGPCSLWGPDRRSAAAHRITCSVFQEGKSCTSVCKDYKLQPTADLLLPKPSVCVCRCITWPVYVWGICAGSWTSHQTCGGRSGHALNTLSSTALTWWGAGTLISCCCAVFTSCPKWENRLACFIFGQ